MNTVLVFEWVTLTGVAGILIFLWTIHASMRAVSDRVSRLEGVVVGLEGQVRILTTLITGKTDKE